MCPRTSNRVYGPRMWPRVLWCVPLHRAHGNKRIQRLILCRCGNSAVYGQVRQESSHLHWPHVTRVTRVVEKNKSLYPRNVRLLSTIGLMLNGTRICNLFEKPWLSGFWGIRVRLLRIVSRIWDLQHSTDSVCGAARQLEQRSVAVCRQVRHIRIDISRLDRKTAKTFCLSLAVQYLFAYPLTPDARKCFVRISACGLPSPHSPLGP